MRASDAAGSARRELSPTRDELRFEIDELEIDHLGGVAGPVPELDDPGVAARAVGHPGTDLGEELVHRLLRAEYCEGLPTRVEIAAPAQRDHLLGKRLHGLRL